MTGQGIHVHVDDRTMYIYILMTEKKLSMKNEIFVH